MNPAGKKNATLIKLFVLDDERMGALLVAGLLRKNNANAYKAAGALMARFQNRPGFRRFLHHIADDDPTKWPDPYHFRVIQAWDAAMRLARTEPTFKEYLTQYEKLFAGVPMAECTHRQALAELGLPLGPGPKGRPLGSKDTEKRKRRKKCLEK
jgi:hypothetical protein